MSYLNYALEPGDSYCNRYRRGMTLPHDADVKDPIKLAALSGPVDSYQLEEVESDVQNR